MTLPLSSQSHDAPRVWHLCSNRWNSAITEYALSCAQALARRGWQSYYSALGASPGARRAQELGLPGSPFPSFGPLQLLPFWKEAARIKPHVLLLYGGPETFLSRFLPQVPKLRFRGQDSDAQEELAPWRTRWSLAHCEAVLTPAQRIEERFAAVLRPKPVHRVILGLDAQRYAFAPETWRPLDRPTLRILGRLDPIKGQREFFADFRRLLAIWPASEPEPLLEVVGLPANLSEDDLRGAARAVGLREGRDWRLRAERVGDLQKLLAATHLAVIPSLGSEIICRVAEEFLMAGCPIFVSGVGALEECLWGESAGASYRGLGEEARVELLARWLLRSFREGLEKKAERSKTALRLFSLETMGQRLEETLRPYLSLQDRPRTFLRN